MKQVEIVASFDDNYAQHAAVMLVSVLKHTSRPVAFHFLVSDLSASKKDALEKLAVSYGSSVSFHAVDERAFGHVVLDHLVVHTYFRLLIPTIFGGKPRILYLDVDSVVKGDIGELFDEPLDGQRIAAVADPGVDPAFIARISRGRQTYFNAGVVVMAVESLTSAESEQWMRFAREEHSQITHHDQCVLNHFLTFKKISPRFNLMSQFLLPYENLRNNEYSRQEVAAAVAAPVVIHYNNYFGKPWEAHCSHPLRREYLRFLIFTPWRWNVFRILLAQFRFRLRRNR